MVELMGTKEYAVFGINHLVSTNPKALTILGLSQIDSFKGKTL